MPEFASVVFLEWVHTRAHVCTYGCCGSDSKEQKLVSAEAAGLTGCESFPLEGHHPLCLPTTLLYLGLAPPCLC